MINNNIQEAYCSFEVSKLLKEKGFGVPCREGWVNYLSSFTGEVGMPDDESNLVMDGLGNRHLIERPTHSVAIEWIRVNFGIQISADGDCYGNEWYSKLSVVSEDLWNNLDMRHEVLSATKKFNNIHKTLDEATEAALLYTLQNLVP